MFFLLRLEKFVVFTRANLLLVWSGVVVYGHDLGSAGDHAHGDGAVRSPGRLLVQAQSLPVASGVAAVPK